MRLELEDIKGGVLEQEYSCALTYFPELRVLTEQEGPQFGEPLEFYLRLQRSGQLVEVDGRLDAVIRLNCGRCLQAFEQTVSESFSLTFTPRLEESTVTDEEVELEADELGLIVYEDEAIDLQGPLQEQLIMAVPISPVCSSACRGLCPECGVNLNNKQCRCVRKPFNNKFSALTEIKLDK